MDEPAQVDIDQMEKEEERGCMAAWSGEDDKTEEEAEEGEDIDMSLMKYGQHLWTMWYSNDLTMAEEPSRTGEIGVCDTDACGIWFGTQLYSVQLWTDKVVSFWNVLNVASELRCAEEFKYRAVLHYCLGKRTFIFENVKTVWGNVLNQLRKTNVCEIFFKHQIPFNMT